MIVPDLCVYPKGVIGLSLPDEEYLTESPLLAIEIMTTRQTVQTLVDRARIMLAAGVQSCWLVQPALDLVTVFTEGMQKTTYTGGTITDPATGIEVALDDVFRTAA